MAIFCTPSGPFDYTFDTSFPSLKFIQAATGGSFDFSFETLFQVRATVKGSIGGSTFQQSGRNYSIRHHMVPTLKLNTRRLSSMQLFRENISRYQATSTPERATWEAEKILYPRVRSDGTLRVPNRYHLFISSNQNWTYSNIAHSATIGSKVDRSILELLPTDLDFGASELFFQFVQTTVPAGFNIQIYMTRVLSQSSPSLARARPRLIKVIAAGGSLTGNSFSDYTAAWGVTSKPIGYVGLVNVFLVPITTGQKLLDAFNGVIVV